MIWQICMSVTKHMSNNELHKYEAVMINLVIILLANFRPVPTL